MAFDAQRNRIATNSRFAVPTFDTQVSLFDMEASSQLPFSVILDSEENGVETTNSFDARLTIDAQRNQLLIGLSGSNPRVEFYELP